VKPRRVVSTVAAIVVAFSLGCSTQSAARVLGTPSNLGNGTVASYAEFDTSGAPSAIGGLLGERPQRGADNAVRRASMFRHQQ